MLDTMAMISAALVSTLFATALVLLAVALVAPLARRLHVPRATLLALLGVGLGLFLGNREAMPQIHGQFIEQGLQRLELKGESYLYLFLPPLLFHAGLTVDVRRLREEAGAVLLLAVVAVVITTATIGALLVPVSDLGWAICLMLAAIVATTDPGAVVGIFRDLGAPRRLTVLVEGESLFNDAAAIALFVVFAGMITGQGSMSIAAASLVFVTEMLGGLVFGWLAARLVAVVLPRLGNSPVAEMTLTVALAYIVYVVAARYLNVSGVVAVATAALTLAALGPVRLRPQNWSALIVSWAQLEYWANSLIFVLAAMATAETLLEVDAHHLLLIGLMAAGALIARAAVLWGLLPLLAWARWVEPVDHKYRFVIAWGGLRGAVTLALALSIIDNPAISADTSAIVASLATGFVVFTLLVQAPTLRFVMRATGLDRLTPTERALRAHVAESLEQGMVSPAGQSAPQPLRENSPQLLGGDGSGTEANATGSESADENVGKYLDEAQRVTLALATIAAREKHLYLSHFAGGTISRHTMAELVAGADGLIDGVRSEGESAYRSRVERSLDYGRVFLLKLWLYRRGGWRRPLALELAGRLEGLLVTRLILGELESDIQRTVGRLFGSAASRRVSELLRVRRNATDDALQALNLQFGAFARTLQARFQRRAELRLKAARIRELRDDALISGEVFDALQQDIELARRELGKLPPLALDIELRRMIQAVPLFSDLGESSAQYLARQLVPHLAVPGQRIITRGASGREMYFLVSGTVEVAVDPPDRLGPGTFFGELALLQNRPRRADVVAHTHCQLLRLSARDLNRLFRHHPAIRAEFERVAADRLAGYRDAAAPTTGTGAPST